MSNSANPLRNHSHSQNDLNATKLYTKIIENSVDGILIVDENGIVLFANPAACEFFQDTNLVNKSFGFPVVNGDKTEIELVNVDPAPVVAEMRVTEIEWYGAKKCLATLRDISDRKKIEEKLQKSEKKYRRIFESIHDIYMESTLDGEILEISPSVYHQMGYTPNEVKDKKTYAFYKDPKDRESFYHTLKERKIIEDGEIHLVRKDGREAIYSMTAQLVEDDSEVGSKVITLLRNISDRKENESLQYLYSSVLELLNSQQNIQSILHNVLTKIKECLSLDAVAIQLVKEEEISYFDEIGFKSERQRDAVPNIVFRTPTESQNPYFQITNLGTFWSNCFSQCVEKSLIDVSLGNWFVIPDTDDIYESVAMVPLKVDLKEEGVLHIASRSANRCSTKMIHTLDIIASNIINTLVRLKAIEERESEKERLAVTLKSIGDGVIVTDVDGIVHMMNPVAEALTGWKEKEAKDQHINKIFLLYDNQTTYLCDCPVRKAIEKNDIVTYQKETRLQSKDGKERIVLCSAAPIHHGNSTIEGVIVVVHDISSLRELENEVTKKQKLDSLGVLAGGIAHDFNNILTSIMGNISLLRYTMDQKDDAVSLLKETEEACFRAKDLTMQLLTFSKGGAPIKHTNSIAEIAINSAKFALRGSKTSCESHFPGTLWAVDIDENQIHQVIHNIIINADQAMPGGGLITMNAENITIREEDALAVSVQPGDFVKLSIKDEGAGIPEKFLSQLFDPYFSTKQKGSGLGLATAHSIIRKHDGSITVDSTVGKGTEISIYLPASVLTSVDEPKPGILEPVPGKGKILLMDDEDMILETANRILTKLGYTVVLARDGKEAVRFYEQALLDKEPFDVVIMDLTIPGGMGGEEAIFKLRKLDPNVKALVSSGYSTNPVMAQYGDYGFADVVIKPYNITELSHKIRKVLFN